MVKGEFMMAYMPGPSDRKRQKPEIHRPSSEEQHHHTERQPEQIEEAKPVRREDPLKAEPKKPEKPEPTQRPQRNRQARKRKTSPGFFVLFLITGTTLAILFGLVSFYQVRRLSHELARTQNVLTARITEETNAFKATIQDHNRFLGPNGIIDQYLLAHNLIERKLVDIEDIFLAADSRDFSKVGFFRILITGSRPVWIQIDDQGRRPLSKQLFPGLSKEMMYYYKDPQVHLEGTTISLSRRFDITSGNYENTYLVFFNFGSVKVVQLSAQKVNDVISRYSIWLPAQ